MKTKRSFLVIAAVTLVLAAALGAVVLPRALVWRDRQVATLIQQSKQAKSRDLQAEYLRQAMRIGWGGTAAPRALGEYYVAIGRYDKAIGVLQNWPLKPNYSQLGNYALIAQDYSSAQRLYARAIRQKPTATAYTGLAAALFNKEDFKNGCANAAKATKLDLKDEAATHIGMACLLLNKDEKVLHHDDFAELGQVRFSTKRGVATFLIANRMYREGEEQLLANAQTSGDWLMLAQLASARGDYQRAVDHAQKGIALDVSSPELNQLLASSYAALGQADKAKPYQVRSDMLQAN